MLEGEDKVAESLKDAREKASTATGVALVLFAALTASFLGLLSQIGPFRKALVERMHYESRKAKPDMQFENLVTTGVKNTLQIQAGLLSLREQFVAPVPPPSFSSHQYVPPSPHPASAGQECVFPLVRKDKFERDPNDPRDLLRCLVQSKLSPSDLHKNLQKERPEISLVLLENTIRAAEQSAARINGHVLQRFHLQRAIAQRAQFKLFDVEFSIDGFWAWDVWVALCASGVLYLWLVRRGTFMRCQRASVMEGYLSFIAAAPPVGSWPLWLRPLPRHSRWANQANSNRVDVIFDPLGAACLLMMWVTVVLAIAMALRITFVASFLISKADGLDWRFALHAGVCCLATGIIVGTLLDWYLPSGLRRRSSSHIHQMDGEPAISRRALMLSGVAALATGFFYLPRSRAVVFASILHKHSRDSMLPRGPRKRKRKLQNASLAWGFYKGSPGWIYYMPPDKRSRSMDGLSATELIPYNGPFNIESLPEVHPSALIPFVRYVVSSLIPRPHELWDRKLHEQMLAQKSVQGNYRTAFELTLAATHHDSERRGRAGKLPNLQLYDLLGALAQSSGSPDLLTQAREELAKAFIRPATKRRSAEANRAEGHETKAVLKSSTIKPGDAKEGEIKAVHSGHRHRKSPGAFVCRRQARLDAFRLQRLGKENPSTPGHDRITPPFPPLETSASLRPATWSLELVSEPALQCSIHVVRQRKHSRIDRQRKRKGLKSC